MKQKPLSGKLFDSVTSSLLGQEDAVLEDVLSLVKRRAEGKKSLSGYEESLLADTDAALTALLKDSASGYRADQKKGIQPSVAAPLPYSSFAEGLLRLQERAKQRGSFPKLRKVPKAGVYRPDTGKTIVSIPVTEAKINAIVKMARIERARTEHKSSPCAPVRCRKSR